MSKIITLRKGLDINLQGKAVEKLVKLPLAPEYTLSRPYLPRYEIEWHFWN